MFLECNLRYFFIPIFFVGLKTTGIEGNRGVSSSEEECASGSSDGECLPVQTGANREVESSSDSEGGEAGNVAEGVEDEQGDEAYEGNETDEPEGPPPSRSQGKKAKEKSIRNVWKAKDNQFEGDLPPFSGESKMNVEVTDPIDLFIHLFTKDMIDDIVYDTNLYAVQKRKDKLALTSEEFKTFLGMNMVMSNVSTQDPECTGHQKEAFVLIR